MNTDRSAAEDSGTVAPRVLLADTTRYSSAPRLAVELAATGISVSAVCPDRGHPLEKTSAVRELFPYRSLHPHRSLAAAINTTQPDIIIPCDDRAVQHLHELHALARQDKSSGNKLAILIERSLGSPEGFSVVTSRYSLLKLAVEEGIRVPDTKLITTIDDIQNWFSTRTPPCVLKADGTWGGRGVKTADTLQEAEQTFKTLSRPFGAYQVIKQLIMNRDPFWIRPWWEGLSPAVIAQSYIHGRPANCAVFCWEGKILAGFGVEVVSTQSPTGPATVVRVVDNTQMMDSAERIARRLTLSGFFGLDFMIEQGSGDTYLIEMNPRCTPLCHLRLGNRRDMVGSLWAQLFNRPLCEPVQVTQRELIAYFPQAWAFNHEIPESCYEDIPYSDPILLQEMLRPWPERNVLARLVKYVSAKREKDVPSTEEIFRSHHAVVSGMGRKHGRE